MARTIKEIEAEMRDLLDEYYRACLESRSISFQGAVSEIAWDIEQVQAFGGKGYGDND